MTQINVNAANVFEHRFNLHVNLKIFQLKQVVGRINNNSEIVVYFFLHAKSVQDCIRTKEHSNIQSIKCIFRILRINPTRTTLIITQALWHTWIIHCNLAECVLYRLITRTLNPQLWTGKFKCVFFGFFLSFISCTLLMPKRASSFAILKIVKDF